MKLLDEGRQEPDSEKDEVQACPLDVAENEAPSCYPDAICPLCSQIFPRGELHQHIQAERPNLRETTILVIQAYHQGWGVDQGACETCWQSYCDAGRMLSLLKAARPGAQTAPPGRESIP